MPEEHEDVEATLEQGTTPDASQQKGKWRAIDWIAGNTLVAEALLSIIWVIAWAFGYRFEHQLQVYLALVLIILTGGYLALIFYPIFKKDDDPRWFHARILSSGIVGGSYAFLLPVVMSLPEGNVNSGGAAALRQAILLATGGLIALIALGETRRKNDIDKRKNKQEKKKNDKDHRRQVRAERRERYTKAVEQLGDEKAPVRMGGVYTLVGLVDEWLKDESIKKYEDRLKEGQVIINNLCAYIRSPFTLASHYDELSKPSPTPKGIYKGKKEKFYADKATLDSEADVRLGIIKEIHDRLQDPDKNTPGAWSDFEYDFSGSAFFYPVDLTKSYYKNPAIFNNSHYHKKVDFSGSIYNSQVSFRGSIYKKKVTFSSSKSRSTYKGEADFSSSKYHNKADFRGSVYKKKVTFSSSKSRSTYKGEADFSSSTYQDKAVFSGSTYEKDVIFSAPFAHSTYKGEANFSKSIYLGLAVFSGSTYEKDVIFSTSGFTPTDWDEDDLNGSTYKGKADFSNSIYKGLANFSGSTYEKEVIFSAPIARSTYKGEADFRSSTYQDKAVFSGSTYQVLAYFSGSIFYSETYFSKGGYSNSPSCFTNCAPQFYDKKNRKNTLFGSPNNDFTVDIDKGYPIDLDSKGIPLNCKFLTSEQKEYLEGKLQEIEKINNKLFEVKDLAMKTELSEKLRSLNEELHIWREKVTTVQVEDVAAEDTKS